MTSKDLKEFLTMRPKATTVRKYDGWKSIENMGLTNDQIRDGVSVLHDLIMDADDEKRQEILFPKGLHLAMKSLAELRVAYDKEALSPKEVVTFLEAEKRFWSKYDKLMPAIELIIKLKEVI